MNQRFDRRKFIQYTTAGLFAVERSVNAANIFDLTEYPKVGIDRCRRYDFDQVLTSLLSIFDMIGGVPALVNGKTVSIKVNLTSYQIQNVYTLSPIETVYTHPIVTLAACVLFAEYGATRIVICESLPTLHHTLTAYKNQGYDYDLFSSVVPIVEFENTRNLGSGSQYRTAQVGEGAYVYQSFDLNHRYVDTDVFVSIAKMKNHDIAGITLSMKNLFGIAPNSIYGGEDQTAPKEDAVAIRSRTFHEGYRRVPASGELQPYPFQGDPGRRVPRIIVDLNRARPIDLAIIDGITTMSGGEGPWNGPQLGLCIPHLLMAGRDALATDAVGAAVMGYDPLSQGFAKPFYNADNTLEMAVEKGMGTNRLDQIEVRGLSIDEARYAFVPGRDRL